MGVTAAVPVPGEVFNPQPCGGERGNTDRGGRQW